jgi:polysaccharide chain length determinant protein (PEP-CTERM system associated)
MVAAIAWRRKWLILLPAVLIAAIGCAVTYSLPDRYRSETTILVIPQRVPENYIKSVVTTRLDERLRSINEQVRSRTRLEQIIEEFKLYPERRKTDIMQDIVESMNRDIGVDIIQGDVFRVSFTADDPRSAQQVTSRLASFFIDESYKDRSRQADGTNAFLETELSKQKEKLIENEMKLAAYRKAHYGELPTQVEANLQGLHNAESARQTVRSELEREHDLMGVIDRRIEDLATAIESAPRSIPSTNGQPAPKTTAEVVEDAKAALTQLLTRVREDHPEVRRMRREISKLEEQAAEEATAEPSPAAVSIDPRVKQLADARDQKARLEKAIKLNTDEQNRLTREINDYQRRIEAAPARDTELTELLRDYKTLQSTYDSLLGKSFESQISANVERQQIGEQFRVLDPARVPERPASPDRPRFYWWSVLGAIAVGLSLAGIVEYLDRGLRSEEDIRLALGLPVLATIPVLDVATTRRQRSRVVVASAAVLMTLAVAAVVWVGLR